jgi:vacuolar-type H+-ATPase subunit I/STV1
MELYRISIPKDDAWTVVEALGHKNFAHFIDLNKDMQVFALPYAFRIKMCDETERRIQYLLAKSKEMKVPVTRPADTTGLEVAVTKLATERRRAIPLLFDNIEQDITQKEQFVVGQVRTIQEMQAGINKLADYCWVLSFVARQANSLSAMAPGGGYGAGVDDEMGAQPLLANDQNGGVQISFVAGTIKADEKPKMERMLFRITRGKALTHFSDDFEQDKVQKVVYMVVYQDGAVIRDRVQKICDSFMGSRFEIPNLGDPLFAELARVRHQIKEDEGLLKTSRMQLKEYLRSINGDCDAEVPSQLEVCQHFVAKEKAIYMILNMMKLREANGLYIGFLWAPIELEEVIKNELANFQTTEFTSWRSNT